MKLKYRSLFVIYIGIVVAFSQLHGELKFYIPEGVEVPEAEEETPEMSFGQSDAAMENVPEQEVSVAEKEEFRQQEAYSDGGVALGQILNKDTGAYVPSVYVVVEADNSEAAADGLAYYAETNEQGAFVIEGIKPGEYVMTVFKTGFAKVTVTDVMINSNGVERFDMALQPFEEDSGDIYVLTDFVVTAETLNAGRQELIELRTASAGMVDFLSMEDFAKFGGSDLADLISRIAGVNVVEGQFAVVRGLGDRYNSTLVNGLPMPSIDPKRQGLQLDLFPTSIIESIVAEKAFLPQLPNNSSGAAFNLATRAYPDDSVAWIGTGVRINENASDKFISNPNAPSTMNTFKGGAPENSGRVASVDSGGFDSAGYKLRAGVGKSISLDGDNSPRIGLIFAMAADTSKNTRIGNQQDRFATDSTYQLQPPNFPENLTFFGEPGSLYNKRLDGSGFLYDTTESSEDTLLGALIGAGVQFDEEGNHRLDATYLFSRSTSSNAVLRENGSLPPGFDDGLEIVRDFGFAKSRTNVLKELGEAFVGRGGKNAFTHNESTISYEVRDLYAAQLRGEHQLPFHDGLNFSWGYTDAHSTSELGDPGQDGFVSGQTVVSYVQNATDSNQTSPGSPVYEPGEYFYANSSAFADGVSLPLISETARTIKEDQTGGRLDLSYDNDEETLGLKLGLFNSDAEREVDQFDNQTFISTFTDGASSPEELVADVLEPGGVATITERFPSFAFASRSIKDGYLSGKWVLWDALEVNGGARYSTVNLSASGDSRLTNTITLQTVLDDLVDGNPGITNGELIGFTDASTGSEVDEKYLLPALTLKYSFWEDWTARFGYGQTIAMPSLRELSPYFSRDDSTGDRILGNPFLEISEVESFNFRLEKNFTDNTMVAVSLFHKTISDPVEQIAIVYRGTGSAIQTYFNNPNEAEVMGIELEARLGLEEIHESLEGFSIGGNVSFIEASVGFPESVLDTYFNTIVDIAPSGPFVGEDGPPLGNDDLPKERRLFDQPEWTVNFDLNYQNPDWGTSVTLAAYAQSDVLTSVGSGSALTVDQFTTSYYQLDFKISQELWDGWEFSLEIDNITDTERGIKYSEQLLDSPPDRRTYKVGRTYSLSATYSF